MITWTNGFQCALLSPYVSYVLLSFFQASDILSVRSVITCSSVTRYRFVHFFTRAEINYPLIHTLIKSMLAQNVVDSSKWQKWRLKYEICSFSKRVEEFKY